MDSLKEKVFDYIRNKYQVTEEYLWNRYPGYAIFRHGDNQKWFTIIMNVAENKLGFEGEEIVDIINVKISDPFLRDILLQQTGFLPGYHISRGNWVSILLDGTVAFDEICKWVEESYFTTASKETKHRLRGPKEWLIPANPKYYDVQAAFADSEDGIIDWKQGKGMKAGDIVFMYVAAPVSAILYQCRVIQTDIPYPFDAGKVRIKKLMKIKLLKTYEPDQFTFERLGKEFGIFAVRGPRGIPDRLSDALNP